LLSRLDYLGRVSIHSFVRSASERSRARHGRRDALVQRLIAEPVQDLIPGPSRRSACRNLPSVAPSPP
jgi:hypothetical protein